MRYQAELVGGQTEIAYFEIMDTAAKPPRIVATCAGRPDAALITGALNGATVALLAEAAQ